MELSYSATFGTLPSVVRCLRLGRAGSLPSGARSLSGLGSDFPAGRWQTNKRCTSRREGLFSSRGGRAFACQTSAPRRTGEDGTRGERAMPARGHRALWHAAASFLLVERERKRQTRRGSSRNSQEHRCCVWCPKRKQRKRCSGVLIPKRGAGGTTSSGRNKWGHRLNWDTQGTSMVQGERPNDIFKFEI